MHQRMPEKRDNTKVVLTIQPFFSCVGGLEYSRSASVHALGGRILYRCYRPIPITSEKGRIVKDDEFIPTINCNCRILTIMVRMSHVG